MGDLQFEKKYFKKKLYSLWQKRQGYMFNYTSFWTNFRWICPKPPLNLLCALQDLTKKKTMMTRGANAVTASATAFLTSYCDCYTPEVLQFAPEKLMVGRRSFPSGARQILRGELLNFQGVYTDSCDLPTTTHQTKLLP